MDDWQLITEYVSTGAESAFRSLVERHLGLVHSVAMREVRDPESAREVSQAVFILLARKASSFRRSIVLSAWLFRTTRFVALRAVRSEYRRRQREQEAFRMQTFNEPSEAWPRVEPMLDETLAELSEADRGALLLRYYEDRSLREVGTKLGINEDAAKKRVSRALDKLRTAFSRRGFNLSGAILAGVISQNMAEATSAAMADIVAKSALSGSSAATPALVEEVLDAWRWAKLKLAFGVGVAVVVALFVVRTFNAPTTSQSTNAIAVASESNEPTAATPPAGIPANARTARPFLFKVIDAETGAGIPGAELHARYWVQRGIEPRDDLLTDAEGVCALPLPDQSLGRLDVGILAPGYVQKFFSWWPDHFGPLPKSYTFKLERGVGIGGSVRDESGRPVANARISLKFPFTGEASSREREKERLGFNADLPATTTDARGYWQCANVPPRYLDFSIAVKHPDFPDAGFSVRREGDSQIGVLSIDDLYAAKAVLTLRAGLSITGIVLDEHDKPVPAAKICVSRWADHKKPATITGPDGKFTVRNLKAAAFPMTVMADGFAPERTNVDPTQTVPLEFRLKPASLLRVRVVDPSGQPVARADVAIEEWREHGSLQLREPTDENGIFEWRSAPSDEVEICVLKGGYATVRDVKVVPDGTEHLVTIKPHFRVIGRVVDAETGMPITAFKAVPGYRPGSGDRWDLGDVAHGQNGQYELNFTEEKPPYSVRILADGFEPAESGPMTDEYNPQTQNFELRRANPLHAIKGVVRLPDGRPAANVDVAVCTIEKGVCIARDRVARNSFAQPIKTDGEGKFEFAANPEAHTIVSVAREGVARVPWKGDGQPLEIRLQPWGRIEGAVRLASGSAGKRIQLLDHSYSRYGGGTSLDFDFSATSDAQGRFVIEQAPPGEYDLYVAPMDGTPYSHRTPVTVSAGQTVRAEVGGGGIMIKGRFELDDSEQQIDWSNQIGFITFQTNELPPQPPGGLDRASIERWKRDFWQSERGRAFLSKEKTISLQVAADGSFTAENVKPGDYELTVNLYDRVGDRRAPDRLKDSHLIACLSRKKISVPESSADQPLDLGTITLLPRGQQAKR